jgi:type VI secretion system secreted protein Hcp
MPTDTTSTDIFMYIEGSRGPINGESVDAAFKDHIQLLSFKVGVTGPELNANKDSESGECCLHDIEVTMATSSATPALMAAAYSGEILKSVTIVMRKAGSGQQTFLQWKLHQVQVASVTHSASAERPTDVVTLKYSKVEMMYFRQNQDGSVENAGRSAGWDADQNKAMTPTLPYKPKK